MKQEAGKVEQVAVLIRVAISHTCSTLPPKNSVRRYTACRFTGSIFPLIAIYSRYSCIPIVTHRLCFNSIFFYPILWEILLSEYILPEKHYESAHNILICVKSLTPCFRKSILLFQVEHQSKHRQISTSQNLNHWDYRIILFHCLRNSIRREPYKNRLKQIFLCRRFYSLFPGSHLFHVKHHSNPHRIKPSTRMNCRSNRPMLLHWLRCNFKRAPWLSSWLSCWSRSISFLPPEIHPFDSHDISTLSSEEYNYPGSRITGRGMIFPPPSYKINFCGALLPCICVPYAYLRKVNCLPTILWFVSHETLKWQ